MNQAAKPAATAAGFVTYGINPFRVESADEQRGVRGDDERLSEERVGFRVRFLDDVLRYAQQGIDADARHERSAPDANRAGTRSCVPALSTSSTRIRT